MCLNGILKHLKDTDDTDTLIQTQKKMFSSLSAYQIGVIGMSFLHTLPVRCEQ